MTLRLLALAFLCHRLLGQPVWSSISLSNGARLRVTASYGQLTPGHSIKAEMAPASGNSFYRLFRDESGLAVYAYELMVERLPGGDGFEITQKPLAAGFEKVFPRADGGKPTPTLPQSRQFQLRAGRALTLAVFSMPGFGAAVTERIELGIDDVQAVSRSADLLRFADLKVRVNGVLASGAGKAMVSGRYTMFYLKGKGAYYFAFDEPVGKGFIKAGSVDGKRMDFVLENERFECDGAQAILTVSERGQVWVYHDPAYQPEGNWLAPLDSPASSRVPDYFTAAADSLDWWLR